MNKVTAFIAAYSGTNKEWLEETVNSIRDQGIEPEVQHDEGITHQRWSKAIQECTTEYIHLAHHDDILLPDFYKETTAYLDSHPECAAVFTLDYIIDERGNRTGQTTLPFPPQDSYDFAFVLNNMIRHGNFLRCPTVVMRTSMVDKLSYPECDSASDTAMWFNILHHAPIGIIPKHLMLYRKSSVSDTQKNIIGTLREFDHVRALRYAVSLRDALEWDTYIGYHKALHNMKDAEDYHRVEALKKVSKHVTLIVAHEPPDNGGTGVIAADRVRKVNAGGDGRVAIYVYPSEERHIAEGWYAGCPIIRCHPALLGNVAGKFRPHVIEFHHTLGWGDGILNIQTEARKELYLHDLWMWRQHPHSDGSGQRIVPQVSGVQAIYANGPYLQGEARKALGCSVGLFDMIELPQPAVYKKRLAFFGGFHPTKGVGVLLQAMRRLLDYQLIMFSNVPKDLMDGRRIYGHPNVFVMGGYRRDELPCLVGLADVVVVPSLFESYGLCAREVEAAGAKVLSTRTGGLPGNIEPGNTEALVEAILNA